MKRICSLLVVILLMISLNACGNSSDELAINDKVELEQDTTIDKSGETSDIETKSDVTVSNNEEESEEVYSNKIYYVGDDIPEGTYIINCTKSEYGMDVVIFESETEYEDFQNAEQFTVGEYRAAIEKNAWANFYIEEGEEAYIGLKTGNIILLDDGMCEFSKYDAMTSNILYSGIYVVGEDINEDSLDIKCTSDYLRIAMFENAEKYSEYHKASRFTNGEESDAIEKYSLSNGYVYKDDKMSVDLKNGMILMIDDGIGEYSVDAGPVINESKTTESETTEPETTETETTEPETTTAPESNENGLRSDFKEAMDSYEAFIDEYIAFMKKYGDNPTDIGLLADYAEYMSKYTDFVADFEKWEDTEMNATETAYYIDVQARVSKKLLEAAQ